MLILGISAFYHDSAVTLVKDGEILTAIEEERFTRVKHDNAFPFKAVEYCLKANDLTIDDIDYVAYYEKPLLKFERILETFIKTYPFSLKPFLKAIPEWLGNKIKVGDIIKKKLKYKGKIFYIPHHLSHSSAGFLTSPFKKSAILTIDGVGDVPTTGIWMGEGSKITEISKIDFPHSLGLFYSTWTAFLGFRVNSDEFKVMGLAAYGKPIYKDQIKKMVNQNEDGSFELDLSYFAFRESFRMWSNKFETEFGTPRKPGEAVLRKHKDLAASLQAVTEDVYFKILQNLYNKTKCTNLCISGGVALNSLANGKIYENTKFKNIHVFGPAGDSGASTGAAFYVYTNILKKDRKPAPKNLYLGSSHDKKYIKSVLEMSGLKYKEIDDDKLLIEKIAVSLAKNKVVGWFHGKMEFGPRALGNRSIIANPRLRSMKDTVNKIKKRESFRPFAGSVLQERVQDLFEVPEKNHYSPFMNFCFQVKPDAKNKIASIVHEDGTCRIQTVNAENGMYYKLINRFYKLTGIPCILNSSFNLSFEPIIEDPKQAIYDFRNSSMDLLVIENFVIEK
jgi:carbamoyltransferase